MFKVKIFSIHKIKENWLQKGIEEYEKRLSNEVKFFWNFFKDEKELKKALDKENFYICLDENGTNFNSYEFKNLIFDAFQKHNPIIFIIGSENGFSNKIKLKANFILSFSKLTFTHQMIRLFLIEQIYRSFQIEKNTNYHK